MKSAKHTTRLVSPNARLRAMTLRKHLNQRAFAGFGVGGMDADIRTSTASACNTACTSNVSCILRSYLQTPYLKLPLAKGSLIPSLVSERPWIGLAKQVPTKGPCCLHPCSNAEQNQSARLRLGRSQRRLRVFFCLRCDGIGQGL